MSTDLFSQRQMEAARDRAALHRIYGDLPPNAADLIGICAELLRRGLTIAKVARLSTVPPNTLQHLSDALGIEIRPIARAPMHLDGCVADPVSHLQVSVFIASVQIMAAMGATTELDAETYCNALRRTERAGLLVDHLLLGHIQIAIDHWQSGDAHLMECVCCHGSYLSVKRGSPFVLTHSARCPFCAGVRKFRADPPQGHPTPIDQDHSRDRTIDTIQLAAPTPRIDLGDP